MSRTPCPLDPIPAPDALKARMTDWRTAHPRATFADLEIEATRQLAAMRAELIAVALVAAVPDTPPPVRRVWGRCSEPGPGPGRSARARRSRSR